MKKNDIRCVLLQSIDRNGILDALKIQSDGSVIVTGDIDDVRANLLLDDIGCIYQFGDGMVFVENIVLYLMGDDAIEVRVSFIPDELHLENRISEYRLMATYSVTIEPSEVMRPDGRRR